MISGVHAVIWAKEAEKARAFFRDVLELPNVDAGDGWLIFALPPAEVAVHPEMDESNKHELYLMCDDIDATVAAMRAKGATFTETVNDVGWGLLTAFELPGGGEIGLYQPRHPTALSSWQVKSK